MSFSFDEKPFLHFLMIFMIILTTLLLSLKIILRVIIKTSYDVKIKRYPQDIFISHKLFIESHAGLNKEIFQNTLESFSKAIEYNIESLETDVWLTKDKVLVLVHGSIEGDLGEYFDHSGNVMNLTWNELSKFRTIQDNLTMPKLSDALKLIKNKIFLNLEIKDPRVDLVFPYIIKEIEKYDFFEQISLSSLYHGYYEKIKEYNKNNDQNIVFGFVYKRNQSQNFDYSKKGSSLNIYFKDATKEVCDKAHQNGMAVLAWIRMKDKEDYNLYRRLADNGVDVICCNDPVSAKKFRDNLYYQYWSGLNIIKNLKKIFGRDS
jgi:glycerophosphoryl diester phosphodiesterase